MTVSPNFLSQSLYFRGYSEKLVQLCNALSIDASHIFHEDSDRHYGELAQHINTATVYKILGDFHFSIELEIWGMSQSKFTQILTDFAEVSIALAIPNEKSEKPFEYIVFHDHEETSAEIFHDEVTDEIYVHAPKTLRKSIHGFA